MATNIFCRKCTSKKTDNHTYCQKCGTSFIENTEENPNKLKYDQIPVKRLMLLLDNDGIPDKDIHLVQKLISLANKDSNKSKIDNIKFNSTIFIVLFLVDITVLQQRNSEAVFIALFLLAILLFAYVIFLANANSNLSKLKSTSSKKTAFILINIPIITFLIYGVFLVTAPLSPRIALTLFITDQDKNVLNDTEISINYKKNITLKNKNSLKIIHRGTSAGFTVSKDNYYPSKVLFPAKEENVVNSIVWPFRRIEPWNPTINITLNKIKKPIPLYVKKVRNIFENGEYGYDLIKGDWVSPMGKGKDAHINFILQGGKINKKELFVQIAGKSNGFHKVAFDRSNSNLLQPTYSAPSAGYNNRIKISPTFSSSWSPTSYFFRVRKNPSDKHSGLLYGKMIDSIIFYQYREPTQARSLYKYRTAEISFLYYLNPKINDKNLEFDSTNNLLPDKKLNFRFH